MDDAERRTFARACTASARRRARGGRGRWSGRLAFAILTRPRGTGIAQYFLEHALPEGGGRNVVNVILVDFRGFDTFGEITVVGIVALAVYKLLRRFRPAPESMRVPRAQRAEESTVARRKHCPIVADTLPSGYMRVPAVLGRLLLPVAGVISVFFLLRGHNAPGGGFVGGLVMATAFIVQYMVSGTMWIEARMSIHPQYCHRGRPDVRRGGRRRRVVRPGQFPHQPRMARRVAADRRDPPVEHAAVRPRRLSTRGGRHHADADSPRPPVAAQLSPPAGRDLDHAGAAGRRRAGGRI